MNRPNAEDLQKCALEAWDHWHPTMRETTGLSNAASCASAAKADINAAVIELSKGDSISARPRLLRALYLIGGALAVDKATTPEEPTLGPWTNDAKDESVSRLWTWSNGNTSLAARVDTKTFEAWAATPRGMFSMAKLGAFDGLMSASAAAESWLEKNVQRRPEEPRGERRYTRAEVDELLGRTKTNLETLSTIYHATRDESDANLRRAIAAEMEVQGLRGQMERLAKKGGA